MHSLVLMMSLLIGITTSKEIETCMVPLSTTLASPVTFQVRRSQPVAAPDGPLLSDNPHRQKVRLPCTKEAAQEQQLLIRRISWLQCSSCVLRLPRLSPG